MASPAAVAACPGYFPSPYTRLAGGSQCPHCFHTNPASRRLESTTMDTSESAPLQSEDAQRGSPRISFSGRTETCQRLVNRMPISPKIAVFENTQERFEIPLPPELGSSYPVVDVPGLSLQLQPNLNLRRTRNSFDDRTGVGDRRRKKSRSSHRSSKEKNSAHDNSRRLTEYFIAQDGSEVLG